MNKVKKIINEQKIFAILKKTRQAREEKVLGILKKAMNKKGLALEEAGYLINAEKPKLIQEIFKTAYKIKKEIYGERIVFFAPFYVSNFCVNDCEYCGFHVRNKALRKKLTLSEVEKQIKILVNMGHKRLLLEFGEHPTKNSIDYVINVIKKIYKTKCQKGEIRRINVNIAATTIENYKKLKNANIGTYQLFQETYHKKTYEQLHKGPKANYERQLFAHDRALRAGIDDIGIGVLFGLYDWRFEVLALISHAEYLNKKFGIGPHTISVPRWQPAESVAWRKAPFPVSTKEFLKIIAILRLAVPYTGIIISTRENPKIRAKSFMLGVSQASAASRTSPGGYGKKENLSQFSLSDHRTIDAVIESILKQNLLPSFCTACYRLNRTGKYFMNFAKSGNIKNFCRPNAILTFKEYLEDYASKKVKKMGEKIIAQCLKKISDPAIASETEKRIRKIEKGARDIYF